MPQQTMPITFIKGDEIGAETDYRDALPVNMTAIARQNFGAHGYMLQSPGLTRVTNSTGEVTFPCKGAVWNENFSTQFRAFGDASGGQVEYAVYDGLGGISFSLVGFWNDDTSLPVSLPYSFNTQGLVAKGNFHLITISPPSFKTGGVEIDPLFVGTIDAVWIDGYYFLTNGDSLYHTEINDEELVQASENTAQFSPDPILGLGKTQDNKVIVFGRYTIEYFQNVGSQGFAFQRLEGRAVTSGIVATHAKCELLGSWFYVGGRKSEGLGVHVLNGTIPQRVSTREVEKVLGQYSESDLVNMNMESRSEDGIDYVIIHLPNETLQFNATVSQKFGNENGWSILKTGLDSDVWRANFGMFDSTLGHWIYGDEYDGRVGRLDDTVATQYDEVQEWILFTPFIYLESASIDELEIEIMPGHTTTEDATVFISMSYDGVTHGTEYINEYGLPFNYSKRFISYRHGYVNDWFSFKLRAVSQSRMGFGMAKIKYG